MEFERTTLKADGFGSDLVTGLNNLRDDSELCDFTVCADGRVFHVHKVVLAATCDYFRVMFLGSLRESRENSIELRGLSADSVERIIDFIYTGEVTVDHDTLSEFLGAASFLQVRSALKLCTRHLNSLLTFDNADEILEIADTYSLTDVLARFDELVLKNFEEFGKTELFQNLKLGHLIKYVSNDELHIRCERTLFRLVKQWLEEDDERIAHIMDVAVHVRFALMTADEINDLSTDAFVRDHENLYKLVASSGLTPSDAATSDRDEVVQIRTPMECLVCVHPGSTYTPLKITAFNREKDKFYFLSAEDFCGNVNAQVVVLNNFVYIFRVLDYRNEGGVMKSSLCRFDPRHLSLRELTPNDRPRTETAMVAVNNKLYVIGGSYNFAILDSVEVYDVDANSWSTIEPLPFAVHSHAAVVAGNRVYISGGWTAVSRPPPSRRFLRLDPLAETYESMPEMFHGRRLHCMIAVDDCIYVFGGISVKGRVSDLPIESFDLRANQWTCLSTTLKGRSDGHFVSSSRLIYSIGHEYYEAGEDEIWSFDTLENRWQKVAKAPMKMNFANAKCVMLNVNLNDKKLIGRALSR